MCLKSVVFEFRYRQDIQSSVCKIMLLWNLYFKYIKRVRIVLCIDCLECTAYVADVP